MTDGDIFIAFGIYFARSVWHMEGWPQVTWDVALGDVMVWAAGTQRVDCGDKMGRCVGRWRGGRCAGHECGAWGHQCGAWGHEGWPRVTGGHQW